MSATCVRIPAFFGHSMSVWAEFERPIEPAEARALLSAAPGVVLMDGYAPGQVPTPLHAEDKDEVFVGRIRKDPTVTYGLHLWVVSDNLRKGAATNAVQIAQELIWRRIVPA